MWIHQFCGSGFGTFLTPGSAMRENLDPGSGISIPDNFSDILETVFRVINTLSRIRIQDPGTGSF
jgi:hypothetical protein